MSSRAKRFSVLRFNSISKHDKSNCSKKRCSQNYQDNYATQKAYFRRRERDRIINMNPGLSKLLLYRN